MTIGTSRSYPQCPWTFFIVILFFCGLLCSSPPAEAQSSVTDGVLINADSMFRDVEKKTVKLTGNVQVVFKNQHLSCDKALLDLAKEQITAEGHVVMNNPKTHIEGDKVIFNYKNSTGFIYNAFIQSGQVVFEGEVVEKISDDRYIATNGSYTACETCPPGWSFSGSRIDAEIGGYARIKRPVFRIGGIPVLLLPGLIVPLKSKRQSGFLVPSMDYSKNGGVALSGIYFWAIDRSQDVTLTAKWYELRGYKILPDYRYALANDSKGQLQGAWMKDKGLFNQYRTRGITTPPSRWFVNYNHLYEMPEDYVQRVNIKQVSDLRYTVDFPEELTGHGDPALENKLSISKATDSQYASVEVDMYTNLLKAYPIQPNQDAVHRFPEIRYSSKEQRLGEYGPLARIDIDYVNFARNNYNYDDLQDCAGPSCPPLYNKRHHLVPLTIGPKGEIQRDGQFDRATDLWRTGQRLDLQPSFSYPFQIGRKFDILPSVLYRETQYRFTPPNSAKVTGARGQPGFGSTAARRYVQTGLVAKTEFSRVFGDLSYARSTRWKHSFEPEIGFSEIPWSRRPNHPFFGDFIGIQSSRQFDPLSDTDLINEHTGVQFDYSDRTYDKRLVNFAVSNRLTRKIWKDGIPDYQSVVLFQVAQAYDLKEAERKQSHPWSSIESLLDIRFENFETHTTASYNGYAHVTNTSSRVRLMATPKDFVELSFTQNFLYNENYVVEPDKETRLLGLGAGFTSKYLEAMGKVDYSDITHKVQSWSYGLNIRPPGNCWLIHFEHTQVIGGDAQLRGSLNFDFGGA